MNTKKEEIELVLGKVDACFQNLAALSGLEFERRAGPGLGRALRSRLGLERGVFLELQKHWMESDAEALAVTLSYCAWVRLSPAGHPLYFFSRNIYDGPFADFIPQGETLLKIGTQELAALDEGYVRSHGEYLDLPKT